MTGHFIDPPGYAFLTGTETAAINDAIATLHSSFAGRGGKLILYHGLSDQGMSAGALIDGYAEITPRGDEGPQDRARMFLPGMTHCAGGQSTIASTC